LDIEEFIEFTMIVEVVPAGHGKFDKFFDVQPALAGFQPDGTDFGYVPSYLGKGALFCFLYCA